MPVRQVNTVPEQFVAEQRESKEQARGNAAAVLQTAVRLASYPDPAEW